jgi:RHS repeat-associated protein
MADDPCEAAFSGATPTGPRKYYRARYYDPKIGRFLSEDPISPVSALLGNQGLNSGAEIFEYADQEDEDSPDSAAGLWPEDLNRHAYVKGNPVNFVDPSGEWGRAAAAAAAAAKAGWKHAKQAARWTWDKAKQGWRWTKQNVHWDGPSAGYQHSQGRLCQLRVKERIIFRVDIHTRTPGGPPRWHVHILPPGPGEHGFTVGRK